MVKKETENNLNPVEAKIKQPKHVSETSKAMNENLNKASKLTEGMQAVTAMQKRYVPDMNKYRQSEVITEPKQVSEIRKAINVNLNIETPKLSEGMEAVTAMQRRHVPDMSKYNKLNQAVLQQQTSESNKFMEPPKEPKIDLPNTNKFSQQGQNTSKQTSEPIKFNDIRKAIGAKLEMKAPKHNNKQTKIDLPETNKFTKPIQNTPKQISENLTNSIKAQGQKIEKPEGKINKIKLEASFKNINLDQVKALGKKIINGVNPKKVEQNAKKSPKNTLVR